MTDPTGKSKGFGFVSFEKHEEANKVYGLQNMHYLLQDWNTGIQQMFMGGTQTQSQSYALELFSTICQLFSCNHKTRWFGTLKGFIYG